MSRPYRRQLVGQLEEEFEKHKANLAIVRAVRAELDHRTISKAARLREKIDAYLKLAKAAVPVPSAPPSIARAASESATAARSWPTTSSPRSEAGSFASELMELPSARVVSESLSGAAACQSPSPASPSIPRRPEDRARACQVALAVGAVLALIIGALAWWSGSQADKLTRPVDPARVNLPSVTAAQQPAAFSPTLPARASTPSENSPSRDYRPLLDVPSGSTSQAKQGADNGLSYETRIPRPTVKGYYEPKVVPYPTDKPVYVNGYYRKDGTYVQPHFRSLPRR
jgi:hypothetical protein